MEALLLVDIQNDFLPGGALAVPEGDRVVPVANALTPLFEWVVATKDWHPPNHGSFASQHPGKRVGDTILLDGLEQTLWPDHCVQHTAGAGFAPDLDTQAISAVFLKGTDPRIDSYSGFFDNGHRRATGLADYLRERGINELYVMGLATDYCVKFTVLDALDLGFRVFLVEDGTRGVDIQAGDTARAIETMCRAGARAVPSATVIDERRPSSAT